MIRVLLADDQELVRDGFAMILDAQEDMQVVGQAADGAHSVELARALTPDVVVMDVRMPVLDGIEATRLLAGAGVPDPVKVLVVTTFNLDEYVYEALRAGASGFVLKDDPPESLIAAVRTIAGGDALLSPSVTRRVIAQFTKVHQQAPPKAVETLTAREMDVYRLITKGYSNAEIGAELFISDTTVKTHVTRLLQKLDLRDRAPAIVLAYQSGLFDT